jgi:hypothetical protein
MIDQFPIIKIIDRDKFEEFIENLNDDGMKFVELDNKIMVIYSTNQQNINTLLFGYKETHNVSIPIASAITAYARIHMS